MAFIGAISLHTLLTLIHNKLQEGIEFWETFSAWDWTQGTNQDLSSEETPCWGKSQADNSKQTVVFNIPAQCL